MDELPELPFEKVLSYLSLKEVIKLRAVSRSCYWKVDNYKVKRLCCSRVPFGHIYEKHRWVSGAFAQNFIVSSRFESFFKTFGQTILSHLKHLRLYDPDFHAGSRTAFTDALNSFSQLEELDIIGKWIRKKSDKKRRQLELNLPMLKSIQFKRICGIEKLTLNAPKLKRVKLNRSRLFLDLVHGESVESLLVQGSCGVKVESLKNLKHLYLGSEFETNFALLFCLEKLREIHLTGNNYVHELFGLKRRYGRVDLQVYCRGCLLNDPNDLEMDLPRIDPDLFNGEIYLNLDPSRLADEISFWSVLNFMAIELLTPKSQATILNRFIDLCDIYLNRPVQDIDRFLNFLNTFSNIASLHVRCDRPQILFDRLPEHGSIQKLNLMRLPSDFKFLFRLEHLIELHLHCSVDIETIRMALEELPFLENFEFRYPKTLFVIYISIETPKRFEVYTGGQKKMDTRDMNAVLQFIQQNAIDEDEQNFIVVD